MVFPFYMGKRRDRALCNVPSRKIHSLQRRILYLFTNNEKFNFLNANCQKALVACFNLFEKVFFENVLFVFCELPNKSARSFRCVRISERKIRENFVFQVKFFKSTSFISFSQKVLITFLGWIHSD